MDDGARKNKSLGERWSSSHLAGGNAPYVEGLYEEFLHDPKNVNSQWRDYFEGLPRINGIAVDISHADIREDFRRLSLKPRRSTPAETQDSEKQVRVLQLINAYRFRGHQIARFDPLGVREIQEVPDLRPEYHGMTENDLDKAFDTGSLVGAGRVTLREILEILRSTYCGSIGAEYMHITSTDEKRWLQQRLESERG